MTPNINWTALASLLRTLVILAASTFVGALVLPVAADGTLPLTWAAWKPVLAVAGSAAGVAEVVWIRSHLSALAAAAGVAPATAPAAKTAQAGFVRLGALLALLVVSLLGVAVLGCPAVSAAAPSGVAAVACVIGDAEKGDSVSQIVLDCGGDVAQVIAILADPANYAAVKGTPAYAEAGRAKVASGGVQ